MSGFALAALALTCAGVLGCGPVWDLLPQGAPDSGLSRTVSLLTQEVIGPPVNGADGGIATGDIAVLGFRDEDGKQTVETRAIDDHLLRAVVGRRAPVAPGVGLLSEGPPAGASWKKDAPLPADWETLPASRLLSGTVYHDSPWAYVRLVLTERGTGAVLRSQVARLTERELARAARAQEEHSDATGTVQADAPFAVGVDLHFITWRVSGSFTDPVQLREGATLAVGDRMQLRYTTDTDCVVWAFVFRSDGQRYDLIDIASAYAGREQIVGDFTFEAENVVHTLYFAAAEEIDIDRSDLFEEIGELIDRGELHRFQGVDLVDDRLAAFLIRGATGESPVLEVVRGHDGIETGPEEKFLIGEESLVSSPELLSGSPLLLRAITVDVQAQ